MRGLTIVVTGLCCALNACGSTEHDDDDSGETGDNTGTGGSGGNAGGGGSGGGATGGSAGAGATGGSSTTAGSGGGATGGSSTTANSGGSAGGDATDGSSTASSGGSATGGGAGAGATGGTASATGGSGPTGMAGEGGTGGDDCGSDEVHVPTTADPLVLSGAIQYYAEGTELPAGRYRVTLVDGCMKYSPSQDWTIHAYAGFGLGWFLGADVGVEFVRLPGTIGYFAANGAYTDFEACVTANRQVGPVEFDFDGGLLGIWLKDDNYVDNVAGEGGRNPVWELVRLSSCP